MSVETKRLGVELVTRCYIYEWIELFGIISSFSRFLDYLYIYTAFWSSIPTSGNL